MRTFVFAGALLAAIASMQLRPQTGYGRPTTVCSTSLVWGVHAKRTILVPPPPAVWGRAGPNHTVLFRWSLPSLPVRCRPSTLTFTIAPTDSRYLPNGYTVPVSALVGSTKVRLSRYIPAGVGLEAFASATTADGRRSEHVVGRIGNQWRRLRPSQPK